MRPPEWLFSGGAQQEPVWEVHAAMANLTTYRGKHCLIPVALIALALLATSACSVPANTVKQQPVLADGRPVQAEPVANVPTPDPTATAVVASTPTLELAPTAVSISTPTPEPTPSPTFVMAGPTPTWPECRPLTIEFHEARRRLQIADAERTSAIHGFAFIIDQIIFRQPDVVDYQEADMGRQYVADSLLVENAMAAMTQTITNTPFECFHYFEQREAVAAAMESPTMKDCSERRDLAHAALPQGTLAYHTDQMAAVRDKLDDGSSGVDPDVAYEVIGEHLYAYYREMQKAAKAASFKLCDSVAWARAAEELPAQAAP